MTFLRLALIAVALAILGFVSLTSIWRYRAGPGRAITKPPGETIEIDEYAFSVVASKWVDVLGDTPPGVRPAKRFLVVTLKVENRAGNVDFQWRHERARLVDARGSESRVSEAGQAALDAAGVNGAREIGPRGSCEVALAFDVDPASGPFTARIEFLEGSLGMIQGILFGDQRLRIE